MSIAHKHLASGHWQTLSLCEQMANIGSEISRALNWRKKANMEYSNKAVNRALELLTLTSATRLSFARHKEIARVREAVVDYFYGDNHYGSSERAWRSYFDHFARAARKSS